MKNLPPGALLRMKLDGHSVQQPVRTSELFGIINAHVVSGQERNGLSSALIPTPLLLKFLVQDPAGSPPLHLGEVGLTSSLER